VATDREAWLQVGRALEEAVRRRAIPTDLEADEAHLFLTEAGECIQVEDGMVVAVAAVREVLGALAPPAPKDALDLLLSATRMARVYTGPRRDHQVGLENYGVN
jgi:hypothetical protein